MGGEGADLGGEQCDGQGSAELFGPTGLSAGGRLVEAVAAVHQNRAHLLRPDAAGSEPGDQLIEVHTVNYAMGEDLSPRFGKRLGCDRTVAPGFTCHAFNGDGLSTRCQP